MILPALARTVLRGTLSRSINTSRVTPTFVTASQRTFFVSALCASPAAKAAGSKATTGRGKAATTSTAKSTTATKSTSKTPTKPKTKAAATTKTKTTAKPKARKVVAAKPKPKPRKKATPKPVVPKLTAEDKPPKRAMSSYMIFATKYRAGQPKITSLPEAQAMARNTAAVWNAMSAHEKQAFADEHAALKIRADAARAEWERTVDPEKLKLLNKQRAARGLYRVLVKAQNPKPPTPYLMFYLEWRQKHADDGLDAPSAASKAGEAWRALTVEERQVYQDRYKKEITAFRAHIAAEQSASTSA